MLECRGAKSFVLHSNRANNEKLKGESGGVDGVDGFLTGEAARSIHAAKK